MSAEIKAIQRDIVHRICSGQVVLNLATAIKELVENSSDAGATTIDVRLKEYGSELIEVVDNGSGIHPNNFQALTLKHHTSKLNDFSDLVNVETFGFRGEALSSLCAVSDVIVTTRHESEKHGSKLTFDNLGVLQSSEPCARQIGTTVSLANIFSSLPVRRKEFHRNLKKEFHKAVQILSAYCLIAANVKITCVNRTKKGGIQTFLSTQENKTIRDNISCVFGSKQLSTLLEIVNKMPNEEILSEFGVKSDVSDSFTLYGYISSCEHGVGRSSADRQFYFVNGRPCEPSKVIKLVNEVYHQYNQHQFPFVLMNIVVSKHMVDVNVTPDKRLLFLQNENHLFACVKSTLIALFENIPSSYKMNNPLCGLPSSNVAARERPKFALSTLDKWRHANDKGGDSNERKRCNDESERKIVCKQMKLDFGEKSRANANANANVDTEPTLADSCTITRNFNQAAEAGTRLIRESWRDSLNLNAAQEPRSVKREADHSVVLEVTENVAATTSAELSFSDYAENEIRDDEHHSTEDDSNISIDCENDQVPDSCRSVDVVCDQERIIKQRNVRKSVSLNTCLLDIRRILKENALNQSRSRNDEISNRFHAEIDPNKNKLAEEELSKAISKEMFSKMKIIGQFNKGFVITKLENDLFIIDQHATDEKYNFETLQRTTSLNCQKLVIPQDLELTVTNECLLIDNIEVFRKNGFEFLIDSSAEATKRVKLVSIPTSQSWKFGKEDIDEMLFMLQDAPHATCRPSRIRAMFASRACRKSVMIGTPLSGADMKRLVVHMSEIEHPWNCPHGRPTMRHLINLSLLG